MKQLLSLFLLCSIAFCGNAQVTKTVEVVTPGTMGAQFTEQDKYSVKNLILTGSIDARDFKFITDSLESIEVVDFSGTRIMAYSGTDGTSPEMTNYPSNEIPSYAFVRFSSNVDRSYLKKVRFSNSITSIGEFAFALCGGLDTIRIPASVTTIKWLAFAGCSGVISVDADNSFYCDFNGLLLDKSMNLLFHCPTSWTGECVIPETVDSVAAYAFIECAKLESIVLPKSLLLLGNYAFYNCSALKALIVNNTPDKIELASNVFNELNTDSCVLYVPFGTINQFKMASQWDAFNNVREHSTGLVTNKELVNLLNEASSETIYVRSNVNWSVHSDQNWLMLDKMFSSGLDTIVVSATKNTSDKNRVAHLVITGDGLEPITLTVTQSAPELVIHGVSGGLANSLKAYDQRSLMMLKVDGTMDVRDFWILNDSLPMLTSVDLSEVSVTAWEIKDGYANFQRLYAANTIPAYAFNGSYSKYWSALSRIILPKSIQAIDPATFELCIELKEIVIPDSVTSIGSEAFFLCYKMYSLVLGKSVRQMGYGAFRSCTDLKTIRVKSEIPVVFGDWDDVFGDVDVSNCMLQVPYGAKKVYETSNIWKEFSNIVEETEGLYSETTSVKLAHTDGSSAKVKIASTTAWTVQSDQSWLQVSPVSGSGSDSITFIAQANTSSVSRKAMVTFSTLTFGSRTIAVTQAAAPKTIQVKAGELGKVLTAEEKNSISNLILTGTLDARDFLVLRDSMPILNSLDISTVNILKYDGPNATVYFNVANTIPENAFKASSEGLIKEGIEKVILPLSATCIGANAFTNCKSLNSILIPDKVNSINSEAFSGCISLTKIVLPNSLKSLGNYTFNSCTSLTDISFGDSLYYTGSGTFSGCKALKQITLPESLLAIGESVFRDCSGLTEMILPKNVSNIGSYVFQSCTSLSSIVLNNNLMYIGSFAFYNCTKLTEIRIPGSVISLGNMVFAQCASLKSVFVNAVDPMEITLESSMVFNGLNRTQCTLHVPYLTKSLYTVADQWKDFTTILESPFGLILNTKLVNLSEKEGSSADVSINSNTTWIVSSDKAWLKISLDAGSGNDTLKVTATENTGLATRKAIVTFLMEGVEPQRVLVTQEAALKIVTISAGGLSSALTTQEKMDLSKLTIKGSMDARDFKTLRDLIPNLTYLNMYETTVLSYIGTQGTSGSYTQTYPANTIPANAFYNSSTYTNTTSLQKVVLPASITAIGFEAFEECNNLDSMLIPNTVISIGNDAFSACSKLESVTMGLGVRTIGTYAFYACKSLTSLNIPNSVVTIDSYAFNACSGLTSLVIGSNVTTIGSGAFSSCSALTSVVLPNSVKTIGYYAFSYCNGLKSISIPASVTSIGNGAFSCSSLESIYVYAYNPLYLSEYGVFDNVNKATCTLCVPKGSTSSYQFAIQWKDFQKMTEDWGFTFSVDGVHLKSGGSDTISLTTNEKWSVTADQSWLSISPASGIGNAILTVYAEPNTTFGLRMATMTIQSDNVGLPPMSMTVYESGLVKVVNISSGGLYSSLTKDELHTVSNLVINGTMDIRDFWTLRDSMPQLSILDLSRVSITAYSGYESNAIPANAFYKAGSGNINLVLSQVIFPLNITTIGGAAFRFVRGLTAVEIPDKVETIGNEAFSSCTGMKKLIVGKVVKTIGEWAFYNCRMSEVILPNTITTISSYAFENCTSLKSINLPNSITALGHDAFAFCTSLTSIEMPNSLLSLEGGLFEFCTSLSKVTIPTSITTIKGNAFYNCTSLKELKIPSTVTRIGARAFGKCPITTFHIPGAVTNIDYGAFEYCTGLISIYAHNPSPVDLSASYYATVFNNVSKTNCTLYVPAGSKALYAASTEWKDFANIVEFETALGNNYLHKLILYPNPCKEAFRINGLSDEAVLTLMNLNGKVLMTKRVNSNEFVSTVGLAKGSYLVQLKTTEGTITHKLLKE